MKRMWSLLVRPLRPKRLVFAVAIRVMAETAETAETADMADMVAADISPLVMVFGSSAGGNCSLWKKNEVKSYDLNGSPETDPNGGSDFGGAFVLFIFLLLTKKGILCILIERTFDRIPARAVSIWQRKTRRKRLSGKR